MEQTTAEDKTIINLLCNDLYYKIKDIVNKYSQKQIEKDLINAEETLVRVIYRDFTDIDIFSNFGVLFLDDFFIINTFKQSIKGDKESLRIATQKISAYLYSEQCKQQIKAVCTKYNHESKADLILREAIKQVGIYIPVLEQLECDAVRNTIMKLFKQILIFSAKLQTNQ